MNRYFALFLFFIFFANLQSQTVYKLDKVEQYIWDTDTATWSLISQDLYTYDNGGKKETNKLTQYDISGVWTDFSQVNSTYNPNNNLLIATTQTWNIGTNSWGDLLREENTYDASQNIIIKKMFTMVTPPNLTLTYQTDSEFNGLNLITQHIHQEYDAGTMQLINEEKGTYTYDGMKVIQILRQEWDGAQWVNFVRDDLFYDTYLIRWEKTLWEGGDWAANPYEQILQTNNASGYVTEAISQVRSGAVWVNDTRQLNTYDANNNLIYALFQQWNIGTQLWETSSDITQTFDGDNNLIEQLFRNEVPAGRVLTNASKTSQSWSSANLSVSITDKYIAKVYPNPFQRDLAISFETPFNSSGRISVFDITGKLLAKQVVKKGDKEFSFVLPQLSSGTYFLKIITDQTQNTYKIIKN